MPNPFMPGTGMLGEIIPGFDPTASAGSPVALQVTAAGHPAPVPYSTNDGSLVGDVDGGNREFEFNPNPTLLLHEVKNVSGHLLFRNGLLVDEYADYATGLGWFLITTALEGDI